jgi:hypothetical protein
MVDNWIAVQSTASGRYGVPYHVGPKTKPNRRRGTRGSKKRPKLPHDLAAYYKKRGLKPNRGSWTHDTELSSALYALKRAKARLQ